PTLAATDYYLTGLPLSYSNLGGESLAHLSIYALTGALSFVSGRDHENTTDADADADYEVTVQDSNGRLGDTQAISVTVTAGN
ncbi:hypothetical protein, partial [Flavonifractor plautii]|uniref:hypothetical protein n=1 Tax=Flavonifractor plautii TaxID=292800 RepID=UPI003D7D1C94